MLMEFGPKLQTEPNQMLAKQFMFANHKWLLNFLLSLVEILINVVMINNRMPNCYFFLICKCPFLFKESVLFNLYCIFLKSWFICPPKLLIRNAWQRDNYSQIWAKHVTCSRVLFESITDYIEFVCANGAFR